MIDFLTCITAADHPKASASMMQPIVTIEAGQIAMQEAK